MTKIDIPANINELLRGVPRSLRKQYNLNFQPLRYEHLPWETLTFGQRMCIYHRQGARKQVIKQLETFQRSRKAKATRKAKEAERKRQAKEQRLEAREACQFMTG